MKRLTFKNCFIQPISILILSPQTLTVQERYMMGALGEVAKHSEEGNRKQAGQGRCRVARFKSKIKFLGLSPMRRK